MPTALAPTNRRIASAVGVVAALVAITAMLSEPAHAAATTVSLTWSSDVAEYGDPVSVQGTVTPADEPRHLTLERFDGAGWVALSTTTAAASAEPSPFSIPFTANTLGSTAYRVVAQASLTGDEQASAPHVLTTNRRTRLIAASLSGTDVRVGTSVTIAGSVTNGTGEAVVRLVQALPGSEETLQTATTQGGRFSFQVDTTWLNVQQLRVTALPDPTNQRASSTVSLTVRPAYDPRGSASAYQLATLAGMVARFDPCDPITYRVNVRKAPARGLRQVHQAIDRLAVATGLRFVYLGTTMAVPTRKQPIDTDLMIGWATAKQVPPLRGGVVGYGGFVPTDYGREATGNQILKIGYAAVALDVKPKLRSGFGTGPTRGWQGTTGQLLLHELGHAVGLAHTNAASQVMYPAITHKLARYGAGDLTGLHRLGKAYGCVTSLHAGRAETSPSAPLGRWVFDD